VHTEEHRSCCAILQKSELKYGIRYVIAAKKLIQVCNLLTASMKTTVFCDVTPRSLAEYYQVFGETYCLHSQGRRKMQHEISEIQVKTSKIPFSACFYWFVGTTHSESRASQSQASNQPMLGNGGVNSHC
jgi:hypothetical protein